ncbi:MAG: hypothetical protein AB7O95_16845 [Geminicoccaceae bacterium]
MRVAARSDGRSRNEGEVGGRELLRVAALMATGAGVLAGCQHHEAPAATPAPNDNRNAVGA